jgi:hypothetical protein
MKTATWIIALLFFVVAAYFIINAVAGHDPLPVTIAPQDSVNVAKKFDEKGRLQSDATMVKGVLQGPSHNYYSSGKIHSTINFVNGIKEGTSTWFYENGQPYRETPFVKGKINGIQRKYYEDGKVMAEIPYVDNEVVAGTKEYSKYGSLIQIDRTIEVKTDNQTIEQGRIYVDFKLDKAGEKDEYYALAMEEGQLLKVNTETLPNGFHRITLLSKIGLVKEHKIRLDVATKTKMGNKVVVEKEITVVTGK